MGVLFKIALGLAIGFTIFVVGAHFPIMYLVGVTGVIAWIFWP